MVNVLQVVKEDYRKNEAVAGPDLPVEFESSKIELDIPMVGITVEGVWKLTPSIPPVVRK